MASACCAKTRSSSAASDSNNAPRNVPSRGITISPGPPVRSVVALALTSAAAKAGSHSWCLACSFSRERWLLEGTHAGTGSRIQIRSSVSRYACVVFLAGTSCRWTRPGESCRRKPSSRSLRRKRPSTGAVLRGSEPVDRRRLGSRGQRPAGGSRRSSSDAPVRRSGGCQGSRSPESRRRTARVRLLSFR